MPILTYDPSVLEMADIKNGDRIRVDFISGKLTNLENQKTTSVNRFYDAQLAIYRNGGLL
jgi:dihydroxyacid dehydratase/phosphogluconate dehydratase